MLGNDRSLVYTVQPRYRVKPGSRSQEEDWEFLMGDGFYFYWWNKPTPRNSQGKMWLCW